MSSHDLRDPGQFAQERYRRRKRAWLRRIWWALPLGVVLEMAIFTAFGAVVVPEHVELAATFGLGVGVGMVAVLADSPPAYIARWRQGAEGEKRTARALRPLTRNGWTVLHDVERAHGGNFDHVLVGPGGVYLLETKNLHGICSVRGGSLMVRWREEPDDGYENRSIAPAARGAAAELAERLKGVGLRRHWVQPVVVLWADFEQRSIIDERVAWVSGSALAEVLAARPTRLSAKEVDQAVTALPAALRLGRDVPSVEPEAAVLRPGRI